MNVSAILLLAAGGDHARIEGIPMAAFDLLGRSPLLRIIDGLERGGISKIEIVSERGTQLPVLPRHVNSNQCEQHRLYSTAFDLFAEATKSRCELVLVLNVGPYLEIDYADLIRFHVEQKRTTTAVVDPETETAALFLLNGRFNEAAYLFRHDFKTLRRPYSLYPFTGYSNPLRGLADLRRLAIDAFCGNAELKPHADEVRPGVWISSSACVHRDARIVAPAFVGNYAKVRAGALITRCSSLEHHAQVCAGTVIDNATLLPNTVVGSGLDVTHAVVGHQRLFHLGRDVQVLISDRKLIGHVPTAPLRVIEQLASLAAFLPTQFVRGLASSNGNGKVHETPAVSESAIPALAPTSDREYPVPLAGVRRYGNE